MVAHFPEQAGQWQIDGPHASPDHALHVYAYQDARMIAMLDCELRENHIQLRMAYVSPPWRGTSVLHDMLRVLRGTYRHVVIQRSALRRRRQTMP